MSPNAAEKVELLPCGKCGSAGILCVSRDGEAEWVQCVVCKHEGPVKLASADAITAWNTRATTPTVPAIPVDREEEDTLFLVSLALSKAGAGTTTYSMSQTWRKGGTEQEAINDAVLFAAKEKPGFGVWETLVARVSIAAFPPPVGGAGVRDESSISDEDINDALRHGFGDRVADEVIAASPAYTPRPVEESREGCVGTMTGERAIYFLERFKREEKWLGPHEQWALDYTIAALARPVEAGAGKLAEVERLVEDIRAAITYQYMPMSVRMLLNRATAALTTPAGGIAEGRV